MAKKTEATEAKRDERPNRVMLALNDSELEKLRAAAKRMGLPPATYARVALLQGIEALQPSLPKS